MSSHSSRTTSNFTSVASYGYGATDPSVAASMQRPNWRQTTTGSASSQTIYGTAPSIQNSNFGHRPSMSGRSYALVSGATPSIQQTQNNWSGHGTIFPNSLLGTCPSIVYSQFSGGQGQVVSCNFIDMFRAAPSTQIVQQNYPGNWVNSLRSNQQNDIWYGALRERTAIEPDNWESWVDRMRNT